jgi:hypothetical protein
MRILNLTLKKKPFEVTISNEKKIEYRKNSQWIESRLVGKNYDFVKFVNGYGASRPWLLVEFKGWSKAIKSQYIFSNGLIVDVDDNDYEIYLGKIIKTGNI